MRIKQLHVTRYGPMPPFVKDDLADFILIFTAPTERGKTLLIDALVRLLFKKDLRKTYRRHFGTGGRNMNRVVEKPEGFVVMESRGEVRGARSERIGQRRLSFRRRPRRFSQRVCRPRRRSLAERRTTDTAPAGGRRS